jgi:cbb3-type cytochrome oxidase subunit 3
VAVRLVLVAYLGFLYRPSKPIFVNQAMRLPLSQDLNAQSVTERPSQHFKTDVLARVVSRSCSREPYVGGGCFALQPRNAVIGQRTSSPLNATTPLSRLHERIFSRPLYCTHAVSQEEEKLDCIFVKGYLQKEKTMSQNTPAKTRKE